MDLKTLKLQNNSGECVVCGMNSLFSLGAKFYELQKEIVCTITMFRNEHQSYPNRTHGGMITALLDEAIARAIKISEPKAWGVTSSINVKFKKPVPLNENIKCFAKVTRNSELGFSGIGLIEDEQGNLLAVAEATYVKQKIEKVTTLNELVWEKFPEERGLKFVTLFNSQVFGL